MRELPTLWRERADLFRQHGAEAQAATLEHVAVELEIALQKDAAQPLTLAEASRESGYSERRLRELVAAGAIPDAGRKGASRIRRSDLPRKPGRANGGGYDPESHARELMGRVRT